jgi:hypothetical protein
MLPGLGVGAGSVTAIEEHEQSPKPTHALRCMRPYLPTLTLISHPRKHNHPRSLLCTSIFGKGANVMIYAQGHAWTIGL